jgi:hypothetical protein
MIWHASKFRLTPFKVIKPPNLLVIFSHRNTSELEALFILFNFPQGPCMKKQDYYEGQVSD